MCQIVIGAGAGAVAGAIYGAAVGSSFGAGAGALIGAVNTVINLVVYELAKNIFKENPFLSGLTSLVGSYFAQVGVAMGLGQAMGITLSFVGWMGVAASIIGISIALGLGVLLLGCSVGGCIMATAR